MFNWGYLVYFDHGTESKEFNRCSRSGGADPRSDMANDSKRAIGMQFDVGDSTRVERSVNIDNTSASTVEIKAEGH